MRQTVKFEVEDLNMDPIRYVARLVGFCCRDTIAWEAPFLLHFPCKHNCLVVYLPLGKI